MAYSFGDGFDLYAAPADAINGYWDSGTASSLSTVSPGRFSGSQGVGLGGVGIVHLIKSSSVNDAVHHLVVAFRQTTAITGSSSCGYLQLLDGATGQCCIVFRTDGAILLTSGTPGGTTLDTYTGAFPVTNTWYAFEFEVVINNTTGSWAVRKNGNSSNDHALGSLNTRPTSTNNYANRLQVGVNASAGGQQLDDLYWRSDASSVPWLGDIRCVARMPVTDAAAVFSRSPPGPVSLTPYTQTTFTNKGATVAVYAPFVATFSGTIASATISVQAGTTGNLRAAIYDSNHVNVLATSSQVTNPVTGNNTVTFSSPPTVVKGATYYFATCQDVTVSYNVYNANVNVLFGNTAYASFPATNPGTLTSNQSGPFFTVFITTTLNADCVNEPQQDATTSYVYDSTPGDADFYGIAAIASTPVSTIAVTTRGYMQKSDAGSRTAAVQLKSGATTVASPTLTLTTSGWLWAYRTDMVDPNTSAAWTAAAVNNAQVGPKVIA